MTITPLDIIMVKHRKHLCEALYEKRATMLRKGPHYPPTACKFAETAGAPCPTLGERCEVCEREAEAETKAKPLDVEVRSGHETQTETPEE